MSSLRELIRSGLARGVVAALLLALSPAVATAQSVRGAGVFFGPHGAADGGNLFIQISVNAWLDDDGVAHGNVTFEGEVYQPLPGGNVGPGGPADPFIYVVTDVVFDGDTVYVVGIVTSSPDGVANGEVGAFYFTDNGAYGDAINGVPLDAGNITVDD